MVRKTAVHRNDGEKLLPPEWLQDTWTVVKAVGLSETDKNYLPLAPANLSPGRSYPFTIYLKALQAESQQVRFIICCRRGEVFPNSLWEKTVERGVNSFYIHIEDQRGVVYYLYHNLSGFLKDDKLAPATKVERIYDVSLLWLRQFFHELKHRPGDNLKMGMTFVSRLMTHIFADSGYQSWVLDTFRHETQLYNHCLNCCILGLAFTKCLGWSTFRIRDFGLGALVHDIGMIKVPEAVRNKPGKLSEPETELVQRHPLLGFAILKEYSSLSGDSLNAVLQHHECGDGSGYPHGFKLSRIDPMGRVMRIVDAYEAMTSPRSWRPKLEPAQALAIMRQEWQNSGVFDHDLLSAFITFMVRSQLMEQGKQRPG